MAPVKEVRYFTGMHMDKGIDWYMNNWNFTIPRKIKILGEASPPYYEDPNTALLLQDAIPYVRMVVMHRHPLSFLASFYHMLEWLSTEFPTRPKLDSLDS